MTISMQILCVPRNVLDRFISIVSQNALTDVLLDFTMIRVMKSAINVEKTALNAQVVLLAISAKQVH